MLVLGEEEAGGEGGGGGGGGFVHYMAHLIHLATQVYKAHLEAVGFEKVVVTDHTSHVLGGFSEWAGQHSHWAVRIAGTAIAIARDAAALRFVIVGARRRARRGGTAGS